MANQPYALVNPLCLLVVKPREDLTREDLIRVLEEKQIERITFHYTALAFHYSLKPGLPRPSL
jgi:hypothetical protein